MNFKFWNDVASRNFYWLLSGLILIATIFLVSKYQTEIFQVNDPVAYGKAYGESQYVLGDQAINKIDDGTLYIYAAEAYFKGEDPTTINFEHPPLGKYVYGLSLWLFNRVLVINILLYMIVLFLFAQLLKVLQFSPVFILVAVAYLALGSSLGNHLRMALLDTQILIWSLSFFLALFMKKESWQKYLILGLLLGGLISTKYFFPIAFVYISLLVIWAWLHKSVYKISLSLITSLVVYLGCYWQYFNHAHSIFEFVKFEWYRFRWWTGNRTIPKFIILQTIMFGKFPMWWETTKKFQTDGDWNISWPILFVTHLISLLKQKFSAQQIIILLYALGLLMIYLFGSAVYGRYLLQLIPFWIIIIGWALNNVSKKLS